MEELIKLIKIECEKHVEEDVDDDFNPFEASGGNYDDAYSLGISAGYSDLAKTIIALIDNQSNSTGA